MGVTLRALKEAGLKSTMKRGFGKQKDRRAVRFKVIENQRESREGSRNG